MSKMAMKWIGAFLMGVLLAAGASAERTEGGNRREQVRERVQQRQVQRMMRQLEIDTATAQRLGEILKAQGEARKRLTESVKAELERLEEMVEGTSTEAALAAQIDKVIALRTEMQGLQAKGIGDVRSLLGTAKTARFLVMMRERMEGMRERVREGMQNRRSGEGQGLGDGQGRGEGQGRGNWGYDY